ncbi:hypothetical protein TcCL_Unassigned03226 [Trypanosoma cruzi]|nr:hypothetical protein TcCL_Unassigned03226 [Trypanosoma cruzi]
MTRGKSNKQQNTKKEQTTSGKSTAKALTSAGGPTHNKRTRRQQSPTNERRRETPPPPQFNPAANGIRPRPAENTQRTLSEHPHHQPRAEAGPHPSMTRRKKLHCSPALNGTRCLALCDGRM